MKRLLLILLLTSPAWGQTIFTEPWTSSVDSWTVTETSCSGTCSDSLVTTDGNPADSISSKVTGRNKAESAVWSKALTWEAMGIPAGDVVDSVDGQWDSKLVSTAVACSSATASMDIFDSGNVASIMAATLEPSLDVSADAAWSTHNPTGAVNVSSSKSSGSTVTLRLALGPGAGNNNSAACELRADNFKLTIVSHTPTPSTGRRSQTIVTFLWKPE